MKIIESEILNITDFIGLIVQTKEYWNRTCLYCYRVVEGNKTYHDVDPSNRCQVTLSKKYK